MADACPANAVTSHVTRSDFGFGARYAALISTLVWSRRRRLPYCASPWRLMDHGANASALFELVGGPRYGPPATRSTAVVEDRHALLARANASTDAAAIADVRQHYWATPKPALRWYGGAAARHVAVHVRRGDVGDKLQRGRFTSNGLVAHCALTALRSFERARTHLHIFSEGTLADFGPLRKVWEPSRTFWHLNQPLADSFQHMVAADALVVAKSSLSDCAALLSRGRVFGAPPVGGQIRWMQRHFALHECLGSLK